MEATIHGHISLDQDCEGQIGATIVRLGNDYPGSLETPGNDFPGVRYGWSRLSRISTCPVKIVVVLYVSVRLLDPGHDFPGVRFGEWLRFSRIFKCPVMTIPVSQVFGALVGSVWLSCRSVVGEPGRC